MDSLRPANIDAQPAHYPAHPVGANFVLLSFELSCNLFRRFQLSFTEVWKLENYSSLQLKHEVLTNSVFNLDAFSLCGRQNVHDVIASLTLLDALTLIRYKGIKDRYPTYIAERRPSVILQAMLTVATSAHNDIDNQMALCLPVNSKRLLVCLLLFEAFYLFDLSGPRTTNYTPYLRYYVAE